MLRIRPCQRCTKPAVNNRMNPPRQIRSIRYSSSADCRTASNAARSLPKDLLSIVRTATPFAAAFARPPASALLEITSAISAGKSAAFAASIKAAMFDPRPEIRMATRRFMVSPCKVEVTIINHAVLGLGRDHFAEQRNALAALGENVSHLIDRVGFHDGDHADATVEGTQQFEFGYTPLLRQPFEHRQNRKSREINADAEMLGQHTWNIIRETTAGDVRQTLDRTGFANRAQARSHIEPCRRQQRASKRHYR